jgi:hypothetical protein
MRTTLVSLALILLFTISAAAQEQFGKIVGWITTEDGMVVAGAQVTISSEALIKSLTAVSDDRGRFSFPLLSVGSYDLKITHPDYQTFEQTGIIVRIGSTVTLNPVLKVGAFEQTITITGESPLIDVKSTDMGEVVGRELVEKLPTSRFSSDMIALAPSNVGGTFGSTAGGSEGYSNSYRFDGVDICDPASTAPWVYVNVESVEEFEIVPFAGSTADSGGFTGGSLNMVSKSGGNEFSGGVSYYYFDRDFISWNTDDEAIRETATRYSLNNDFTAYVGGPIVKDNAWFFANFGNRKEGFLTGETTEKSTYHNYMIKAAAMIGDDINLWGMYHFDNYLSDHQGLDYNVAPEATYNQTYPTKSFSGHFAWIIDEYNILQAKINGFFGHGWMDSNGQGGARYYDMAIDWYYGDFPYDFDAHNDRINFLADYSTYLSGFAGDHDLKTGFEWTNGMHDQWLSYTDITVYLGEPIQRVRYDPDLHEVSKMRNLTAYITDSWRLSDRILVNAGLRFERQTASLPDKNFEVDGYKAKGIGDIKTFNNLSPRLGFTYKLKEDGSSLIRGSWGYYYQSLNTYMFARFDPDQADTVVDLWDGSDWFEVVRISAESYSLDPDLKAFYKEAFTIGFEQQLLTDAVLAVDYMHSKTHNIIVPVERGRIYEPYSITFGGKDYTVYNWVGGETNRYLTNADDDQLYQTYDALLFRFDKRYSHNWQLQAYLTLSKLYGTAGDIDPGVGSAYLTLGDLYYYQDPNYQINAEGLLYSHRPWNFKLIASYSFPYDISASAFLTYISGARWTPILSYTDDYLTEGIVTFLAEPRGSRALDPVFNADIRISKDIRLNRFNIQFMVDFFNLFNNGTPIDVVQYLNQDDFGSAVTLQDPRKIQLGLRFSF